MNQITLHKLQEACFMGMIIFLPFGNIPLRFRLVNTLHSLPFICCLIGILLLIIEHIKSHEFMEDSSQVATNEKRYKRFALAYGIWPIFCIIIGSLQYPFFADTNMSTAPWIGKLKVLFSFVGDDYLDSITSATMFIYRDFKEELFPAIGGSLFTYYLFKSNFRRGIKLCVISVIILISFCIIYSIPEILWLWTNSEFCEEILKHVNIYIYDVPVPPAWHPPLLWWGQLRSLFDEPSSFGIVGSFCYPLMMLVPDKSKYQLVYKVFLLAAFCLMIIMTQSRTAVCLFIAETILMAGYLLLKKYKKSFIIMLISVIFGLFIYNLGPVLLPQESLSDHHQNGDTLSQQGNYISRNVESLAGTGKRSNGARYGMTISSLKVGIQHPIVGVGKGYESLYMEKVLPDFAKDNDEIGAWMKNTQEKGITKMGSFILNQYTESLATSGLIGLILLVTPPVYLIYSLIKRKLINRTIPAILLIVLIGQLTAMLSGPYWYTYPITIGLLLCCINDAKYMH